MSESKEKSKSKPGAVPEAQEEEGMAELRAAHDANLKATGVADL